MKHTKQKGKLTTPGQKELNTLTIKHRDQQIKLKIFQAKDYLRDNEVNKSPKAAKLEKKRRLNQNKQRTVEVTNLKK